MIRAGYGARVRVGRRILLVFGNWYYDVCQNAMVLVSIRIGAGVGGEVARRGELDRDQK